MRIRGAVDGDRELLERMVGRVCDADPRRPPDLRDRYVRGWGRPGDLGTVAEDGSGAVVGAAWLRVFGTAGPGDGFAARDVPELTVAVDPDRRRAGIGRALVISLLARARAAGYRRVSARPPAAGVAALLLAGLDFVPPAGDPGTGTVVVELSGA